MSLFELVLWRIFAAGGLTFYVAATIITARRRNPSVGIWLVLSLVGVLPNLALWSVHP